jgi:hypothetical protein
MVRQLAQAVSDSPQLARSVVRWDAESVPALLNDWYTAASATPAPSAAAAVVR